MIVLSARFAVLACLCVALPLALPPPVKAAHVHGSHSTWKHASSTHSHQHASPTHSHNGKQHEQKELHYRALELPPLLRRHRAYDRVKAQDHQAQVPRDYGYPTPPRSAFARSRYRQGPSGTYGRRSSIYVPGEHGDTYLVSRTPSRNRGTDRTGARRRSSHGSGRRQVDESNLVLGRIDIMGAINGTQRIASLTVDSTPIDWMSGQSSAKAFTLNASTTNQTQFIMMPMDEPANGAGNFSKHVTLATEVFDANTAEMVMYCATYNPDPGSTSPLLMTPCSGETQSAAPVDDAADPCSDSQGDGNTHQSQIFSYDPSSGRIQPISASTGSSDVEDSSDDSGCAGARVRRDNGNSTTSSSTRPSSTSTSTAPTTSASQQAQNVTLVYVAGALEVPASSPNASSTTTASIGQAPVLTTTITTTVMTTVTNTGPSNRTATPAQAAAISTVSLLSTMTVTTPASSTSDTASRSSSSSNLSSSAFATATSTRPANADESLEVEVVGGTPSTTSSSSSTSSTTTTTTVTAMATTTSSSSSSASPSPSLNPLAVAASLANEMAHPRSLMYASAGVANP